MQASDIPSKFNIPFANSAGGGFVRSVPQASQIGVNDGWASLTDGFPPLNFQPIGSGGVPPFGQDMNGIIKQITQWSRWQGAGGAGAFDSVFAAAVGGYPKGAFVASATLQGFWICLADNNTVNPDTSVNPLQQGWLFFGGQTVLQAAVTLYVNQSTGSDSYDGSSATHTSGTVGPFATLTKALTTVSQFAPGTFGATISIAAGTQDGGASGFSTASWPHCNVTIVGAGAGVTLLTTHSASGNLFTVNGPTSYTIHDMDVSHQGSTSNGSCLGSAASGSSLTSYNIRYQGNSCAGGNFINCQSGVTSIGAGTITLNANVPGNYFQVNGSGSILAFQSGLTIAAGANAWTMGDFILAANAGFVDSLNHSTFSGCGALVGTRYNITNGAIINTAGGGGTYFPGSIAGSGGTTAGGGFYI